jgi:8-oxo-dGTP diphosphatase
MPQSLHLLVVSCLVRNLRGEILLVRHNRRGWELPQGRVEEGESLLSALHREVREETGVSIESPRLAGIWSKLSGPSALIHGFLADYVGGELTPSMETPEVAWFSETAARGLAEHPVNVDRIQTLLNYNGTVCFFTYATGPYQLQPDN